MFVYFLIEMPVDDMYKVTKTKLRSKKYQIWLAEWDRIKTIVCDKCGYREKI